MCWFMDNGGAHTSWFDSHTEIFGYIGITVSEMMDGMGAPGFDIWKEKRVG